MSYLMLYNEKVSDVVQRFDLPYDVIRRYNPFVDSMDGVYPGRSLQFPRVHVALPGDTYDSIGERYGVLPAYLRELNPHAGDQRWVYPGQTVFLPPPR